VSAGESNTIPDILLRTGPPKNAARLVQMILYLFEAAGVKPCHKQLAEKNATCDFGESSCLAASALHSTLAADTFS
jgi:hypothetical protein